MKLTDWARRERSDLKKMLADAEAKVQAAMNEALKVAGALEYMTFVVAREEEAEAARAESGKGAPEGVDLSGLDDDGPDGVQAASPEAEAALVGAGRNGSKAGG